MGRQHRTDFLEIENVLEMNSTNKNIATEPGYLPTGEFGAVISQDGMILSPTDDNLSNRSIFDLLPDTQGLPLRTMLYRAGRCKSSQVSMSVSGDKTGDMHWEVIKMLPAGVGAPAYLCLGRPPDKSTQPDKGAHGPLNKCKAVPDQTAPGILLQNKEGMIMWANEKAARLLKVAVKELFLSHFLEELWKTYHINRSVPNEDRSLSGSAKPGLLSARSTLVIKTDERKYRTLSFNIEDVTGAAAFPSAFILTRIKDIAGEQAIQPSRERRHQDWVWMKREQMERAIEAAKKAEQLRIGHELHDNINQMLAVTGVYLSLLHPDDTEEKVIRDKAEHILRMAIEEIRCLSHGLVKPSAIDNGLIAAISGLVDDLQHTRLFNITFTYNSSDIESVDQAKKVALYRIVQEQLNNIVKYSHAKNVRIGLESSGRGVRLSIEDDGIGFNKITVQKGIGLRGIYKKAELCNGSVELQTSPGQGCVLRVTAITAAAS